MNEYDFMEYTHKSPGEFWHNGNYYNFWYTNTTDGRFPQTHLMVDNKSAMGVVLDGWIEPWVLQQVIKIWDLAHEQFVTKLNAAEDALQFIVDAEPTDFGEMSWWMNKAQKRADLAISAMYKWYIPPRSYS